MYHAESVITLRIAPWVSAGTVYEVYRDIQRRILGQDNRPIGEMNLKLLQFVEERIDPVGLVEEDSTVSSFTERLAQLEYAKVPEGRRLVKEWDEQECVKQNPNWAYGKDTRRFWRDYHRTLKAVAWARGY